MEGQKKKLRDKILEAVGFEPVSTEELVRIVYGIDKDNASRQRFESARIALRNRIVAINKPNRVVIGDRITRTYRRVSDGRER